MTYLFAAYSVIWILLAGYIWLLGKRQKDVRKEIMYLKELSED